MKVKNFAPGPSKIPKDILDEISQDVLDFRNLGQSVLELSHSCLLYTSPSPRDEL